LLSAVRSAELRSLTITVQTEDVQQWKDSFWNAFPSACRALKGRSPQLQKVILQSLSRNRLQKSVVRVRKAFHAEGGGVEIMITTEISRRD
jgi:hypothetical protein